ncbi:MAG: HAMP domain-containing protein [Spirochaetota bacterium]|nr:HAMP domain-containing protein [Spirochaetota bacterium]
MLAALAAILLGAAAGLWMGRSISKPIVALRDTTLAMAGGDLGARAAVQGTVETRQLAGAFNDLGDRLGDRIEELRS